MTQSTFDEGRSPPSMAPLAKSHRRAGLYRQHGSVGESAMTLNAMEFFCYVNFVVCVVDLPAPGLFLQLSLFHYAVQRSFSKLVIGMTCYGHSPLFDLVFELHVASFLFDKEPAIVFE